MTTFFRMTETKEECYFLVVRAKGSVTATAKAKPDEMG